MELSADVTGLEGAVPVLEDLPDGDLAREVAEEKLGRRAPEVGGAWAVAAVVNGVRLLARGAGDAWTILRPADEDEGDATWAATRLHRALGGKRADWDSDR